MPRTKSLATLINHYGNEREFKLKANKISDVYKILNREIFNNRLKKPFISEDGLFLNSALSFRAVYALLSYLETKDERNLKLFLHYLKIFLPF